MHSTQLHSDCQRVRSRVSCTVSGRSGTAPESSCRRSQSCTPAQSYSSQSNRMPNPPQRRDICVFRALKQKRCFYPVEAKSQHRRSQGGARHVVRTQIPPEFPGLRVRPLAGKQVLTRRFHRALELARAEAKAQLATSSIQPEAQPSMPVPNVQISIHLATCQDKTGANSPLFGCENADRGLPDAYLGPATRSD